MRKGIKIIIIILIILIADVYFELNIPYVDQVEILTDKIEKGSQIKILSIADVHSKYFGQNNKNLYELIKKSEFDLIAVTGDVADIKSENQEKYIYYFFDMLLQFDKPIFYVSGNHEKWESWENISKELMKKGVNVLINEQKEFKKDKDIISICGIEDYNTKYYDLKKATNQIRKEQYSILLSHTPEIVKELAGEPIDLVLSGHTHGGQIRFPFSSDNSLEISKFSKGLYHMDGYELYIDSGLATARFPIRFFNRSKITTVKIIGTTKNND